MAKITRSVLKEIVKECLVEILSEGLHSNDDRNQLVEKKKTKKRSLIESDVFVKRNKMLKSKTNQNVNQQVDNLTDDPMMRDILADTASTTLLEQREGKAGKQVYMPGDAVSKIAFEHKPEDLFEGSQNWASLAFSGAKK